MKYNQKVEVPASANSDLGFMTDSSPFPSNEINPRLLEALASLNQIGAAVNQIGSNKDQETSLQLIVESATRVIPRSSASIYTFDAIKNELLSDSRVFVFADNHPPSEEDRRRDIPRPNGFGMRSIKRLKRAISYEESDMQIHPFQSAQEVKVVAAFPLIVTNEVLGVLYIYLYEERKLSQLEELMLANFVNQAAMAIYHTRRVAGINRDLAQKVNELSRLRHAGLLISSRLRLEETLEAILELALELTDAQYGIFRLVDKSGEFLVTRAISALHLEKPLMEMLPIDGKSVMAYVARTREPLLIRDLHEERWTDLYYPLDSRLEMRSELCVPLINSSGRLEGVLNLESPEVGGFNEENSHMLQSLATYAITAIQEARLLDALQEAAQRLISQPSQKVWEDLCSMANDLLNASSSGIWLTDDEKKLTLVSSNGVVPEIKTHTDEIEQPNTLIMPLTNGQNARELGIFGVFYSATGVERSEKSDWDRKVLACLANYAVLALQNESRQQALRTSQEQHLIAETFAAVGDISANLLHSMNNKVGLIPVRVQSIQEKYEVLLNGDTYLKNSLSEIEHSATAAMQIVQENLSHLRPIRMERIKVEPRVMDAIRAVQAPPEIEIRVEALEELPMIQANGQSLTFVFRNLIENAMEAMHRKGTITIQGALENGSVEIRVTDTGPGISPELHEQIFEPTYSSRMHPGKIGFGLWWVKTLMTRLGGTVTLESDGSHGTTFLLNLPVAEWNA